IRPSRTPSGKKIRYGSVVLPCGLAAICRYAGCGHGVRGSEDDVLDPALRLQHAHLVIPAFLIMSTIDKSDVLTSSTCGPSLNRLNAPVNNVSLDSNSFGKGVRSFSICMGTCDPATSAFSMSGENGDRFIDPGARVPIRWR